MKTLIDANLKTTSKKILPIRPNVLLQITGTAQRSLINTN